MFNNIFTKERKVNRPIIKICKLFVYSRLIGALFMGHIDYEFLFKISVFPPYCDRMRLVD